MNNLQRIHSVLAARTQELARNTCRIEDNELICRRIEKELEGPIRPTSFSRGR